MEKIWNKFSYELTNMSWLECIRTWSVVGHTDNAWNVFKIRVGWFMVINVTFNNISVISWRSVLLVKENQSTQKKPPTCLKSLINFIT
jgi:hypothetical protein